MAEVQQPLEGAIKFGAVHSRRLISALARHPDRLRLPTRRITVLARTMSLACLFLLSGRAALSQIQDDGQATSVPEPLVGSAQAAYLMADIAPSEPAYAPPRLLGLSVFKGMPVLLTADLLDGVSLTAVVPGSGTQTLWHTDSCCEAEIWGDAGGALYWVSKDLYQDREFLYRTDGTLSGTGPVQANGAAVQPVYHERSQPHPSFALALNALTFIATADGEAKLYRVLRGGAEAESIPGTSGVRSVVALGNRPFFVTSDSNSATIWTTGTTASPVRVRSFQPSDLPKLLTVAGDRLFFLAGEDGKEQLWVTDGTAAGTRQLTDFSTPHESTSLQWLRAIGKRVYFVADDGQRGPELGRSDGTPSGTEFITDFAYEAAFDSRTSPRSLEELGDRLIFAARDSSGYPKIWTTSVGSEPAILLAESCAPECPGNEPVELLRVANIVVFNSRDVLRGTEPWVSDGTKLGTRPLADLCPGPCSSAPRLGPISGVRIFLSGQASEHSRGIWRTDGTAHGTRLLAPTEFVLRPEWIVALGQDTYFWSSPAGAGGQLWHAPGPTSPSVPVTAFAHRGAGANPQTIQRMKDRLLIKSCGPVPGESWAIDLLDETAQRLAGGVPCQGLGPYFGDQGHAIVDEQAFFVAGGGSDQSDQVWRTDGSVAGTRQLTSFGLGTQLSGPVRCRQRACFVVSGVGGPDAGIWSTDGTVKGTRKEPSSPVGVAQIYGVATNEFYFLRDTGTDYETWRSNGTVSASHMLLPGQVPIESLRNDTFLQMGSTTYFFASPSHDYWGVQLWRTDGTQSGTRRVRDFGRSDGRPSALTSKGSLLYFFAAENGRWGLWRSDGTAEGTWEVRALEPFSFYRRNRVPSTLTVVGERLFFAAYDEKHGAELWVSDGTTEGTKLVKDIVPGSISGSPTAIVKFGERLFFTAEDVVHGAELWTSDGTELGTQLVQDIFPGPNSARPWATTVVDDALVFTADDGLHGRELWKLRVASSQPNCIASANRLCLRGGLQQAEVSWRDFNGNSGRGTAVSLTSDTGYFWFFDASNVEVVLKVLDGTAVNGHQWVFYGALSSVEYTITVTDTQTGAARRYVNPPNVLASVGDTTAFGPKGATPSTISTRVTTAAPPQASAPHTTAAAAVCSPSATLLCLAGGRFALEIAWKDFQGNAGVGRAVTLSDDTGYFWFFDQSNVEVVGKVLDGRSLNGKFWLFYGALSSVEYTLTVTDTQTGAQRVYRNPSGRLASVADTGAF